MLLFPLMSFLNNFIKLNRKLKIFILLLIVFMLPVQSSCDRKQPEPDKYELYIDRAVQVWRFQGAFIVARGDNILARGSRGFADISLGGANTPETKFPIGSMTKSFTAIAILQLAERGLIGLQKPLSTYIPDYPPETGNRITVHDLLCHRSGIPDLVNNPDFIARIHESITPEETVGYFRGRTLLFQPGSRYSYSSSNYVLLGLIVAQASGQPWEQYIEEHICAPLKMTNTGVHHDCTDRSEFAYGYAPDPSGSLTEAPSIHPSCGYAAGGLISTVDDLYRLHMALYDTVLLSSTSLATMFTRHSPTYGYGWMVDDFGGHRLAAHGGGLPGYVSIMQRWIDDSTFVAVLCNNVMVPVHSIANALAAIALGERYEMPIVKTPISIPPERLAEYEGRYRLGTGEYRYVGKDNGRLFIQEPSGTPYPIVPERPDRFFFEHDHLTTVTFTRDSSNTITGYILKQAFARDTAQIER
jgi:CubicO group peptidase (beta-lactamase class C family)